MTALQGSLDAYAAYAAASQKIAGAVSSTSILGEEILDLSQTGATAEAPHEPQFVRELADIAGVFRIQEGASETTWLVSLVRDDDLPVPGRSSESPFEELDIRRYATEEVADLTSNIRRLDLPYAKPLARRIRDLVKIAEEEAPDQAPPSVDSLRTLVRMLESTPGLECSSVVLTPDGNFRVQWREGPNRLCAAELYPGGQVHFVIFAPDPNRSVETVRLSGIGSVQAFLDCAADRGAAEWIMR